MNTSPTLLVLDTSTSSTVLGLTIADRTIDCTTQATNSHSREVLPAISRMVEDAGIQLSDIDAFVFGQGPGSFTGLRIAAGVVQGLAYGTRKPVIQVSTMAALAQSQLAVDGGVRVCVALTARLEEVYFGAYGNDDGVAHPLVDERVVDVSALPRLEGGPWIILGDASEKLGEKISAATGVDFVSRNSLRIPQVHSLAEMGRNGLLDGKAIDGLQVAPVYLREEVASKPGSKG